MPKTATKILQWRIFARHSEIYYLGRFDGEHFKGKFRQYKACRDETVFRIKDEIAYKGIRRAYVKKCRGSLDRYLAEHNQKGHIPVWSWESYATNNRLKRQLRARNLKQVCVNGKILITIRHPVKLLESAFLQQLKRDNIE